MSTKVNDEYVEAGIDLNGVTEVEAKTMLKGYQAGLVSPEENWKASHGDLPKFTKTGKLVKPKPLTRMDQAKKAAQEIADMYGDKEEAGAVVAKKDALADERASIAKKLILEGDISKLSDREKVLYYKMRCDEQGLDPFSQPFSYIVLKGKEVLYANKNCAEQLRAIHQISIEITDSKEEAGCYIVVAKATKPDGRVDTAIAAVPIDKLVGEMRANAIMKTETKAKRRVTLSIQGLNMLDETEVATLPEAHVVEHEPTIQLDEVDAAAEFKQAHGQEQTKI